MPFSDTPEKLGLARRGDRGVIWIHLNALHPHVEWAVRQHDPVTLRQLAATIFAVDQVLGDLQLKIPFSEGLSEHEQIIAILSRALKVPTEGIKEAPRGRS